MREEQLPSESRCWAGYTVCVKEPLSFIFFLFSAGRVLAEKCWFGMELVFHAMEHGGGRSVSPKATPAVSKNEQGPVRTAANTASHLLFNTTL